MHAEYRAVSGPMLQFMPMTSTPSAPRRAATSCAVTPVRVRPSSAKVICATIGIVDSERNSVDRGAEFGERKRLENEQIDTRPSRARACSWNASRMSCGPQPAGSHSGNLRARWGHRPCYQDILPGDLFRLTR